MRNRTHFAVLLACISCRRHVFVVKLCFVLEHSIGAHLMVQKAQWKRPNKFMGRPGGRERLVVVSVESTERFLMASKETLGIANLQTEEEDGGLTRQTGRPLGSPEAGSSEGGPPAAAKNEWLVNVAASRPTGENHSGGVPMTHNSWRRMLMR